MVEEMVQLMHTEAIVGPRYLVVDGTGVVRPVVDMRYQALPEHYRAGMVKAVTIMAAARAITMI
jgi:hypothetical protein